jgi:penicillin G amidase
MRRKTVVAGLSGISVAVGLGVRARQPRRRLEVPGLVGPVAINRDELGVPHIVAQSNSDAYLGMGYAIAEDRLFQMDLLRRTAYGQLSEIVGPVALGSDRFMRMLGIHRVAPQLVAVASEETRAAAEAFAAGVNLFMRRRMRPIECRVLRYCPAEWTAADSLVMLRLMGWTLSAFHRQDLLAELLRSTVGDEWTEAIFTGRICESPLVVRDSATLSYVPPTPLFADSVFPTGGASNAWAVSGERSVTGAPLLASDPHLGYTNPSIWCEASLEAPGLRVSGVTMPGIPGIVIGRTPTVAWGVTAAMISQTFLYRERLNEDGTHVLDGTDWQPLNERVETIAVKGEQPERFVVRSTSRGPLLSDLEPDWVPEAVSFHWTGMLPSPDTDAVVAINRATSLDDALAARGMMATPPVNVAFADASGEIAVASVGAFADRPSGIGLLDPAEFPPRYVPPTALPIERNPERGWVACANNRIVGEDYPYALYGFYEPPFRIRRISDVLESQSLHAVADMRALQLDLHSIHAAELTPIVIQLLGNDAPQWALDDLSSWDFTVSTDSRAALLFEAFYHHWQHAALAARLPENVVGRLMATFSTGDVPRGFCDRLLQGDYPAWISDEERQRIVRESFVEALRWIVRRLGPDHEFWTWGEVHTVTFVHPFGQASGRHQRFVNIGPFPIGGNRTTVWPSGGKTDELFSVTGGPSMRFVADLRRMELSWITNTLGQAGRPLSRHSRSQVQDFVTGRMHQIWGQPTSSSTHLVPTTRS